jgi:hypothetical protein
MLGSAAAVLSVGATQAGPATHPAAPTPVASGPTVTGTSGTVHSGPTAEVSQARVDGVDAARTAFLAAGGNLSDFFPPSVNAPVTPPTGTGGHVVPLYDETPDPMGIATYGLRNTTGTTTPYILNTTSVEGTFSTTDPIGVQAQAYDAGGMTSYGAQLNVIEVGTTLNGVQAFRGNTNEFWLQNTLGYNPEATSNQLSFDLNIWNFSYNPQGNFPWAGFSEFPKSTILHGLGSVSSGELYETGGPSITVSYPFTMDVYINTTVGTYMGSQPVNEVYFNYSVWNSLGQHVCPATEKTGLVCGEYDNVYFGSTNASHPLPVAAGSAQIQANGYNYASDGNGTNLDMEFDYGIGGSDAAVADTVYADANLGLLTLNATTHQYQEVPSAYDFGSETGESTMGSYGTWSIAGNGAPIEHLTTGPAIETGLWNASGPSYSSGASLVNYAGVEPENAWVAYAQGVGITNQQLFRVAPTFGWFNRPSTEPLGPNTYLQPGIYTVEVMLSGYDTWSQTIDLTHGGLTLVVNLVKDPASTTYTPLWAFSNAELASISTSGAGTAASPYVLWDAQHGSLNPLFGSQSQWPFEVWEGIFVNATTAHADWAPLPSLSITYPWWETQFLNTAPATGPLPTTNQLQIYLYHTQNLSIEGSSSIGGWFASAATTGYNLIANGVRNVLIANNTFSVSNLGLEFMGTGGGNNTVWGNTFTPNNLFNSFSGVEHPSTGLSISGDTLDRVYNNEFFTNSTASGTTETFWNVTCVPGFTAATFLAGGACEPASYSQVVNGYTLTGSILGTSYQGGNFWFNYGNEPNPYANVPYVNRATSETGTGRLGDTSALVVGARGDYAPLISFSLHLVTISESGLPAGTTWTALVTNSTGYTFLNTTSTTTSTSLVFYFPNGAYTWVIPSVTNGATRYVANNPTGTFTISGGPIGPISVMYQVGYLATFTETGLRSGTAWQVRVAGQAPATSITTTATVGLLPGSYSYSVPAVAGYTTTNSGGTVTVTSAPVGVSVPFTAVTYAVTFTESGLPALTNWTVTTTGTGGSTMTGSATTLVFSLVNGSYTYSAPATGSFAANPAVGAFTVAGSVVGITVPFGAASPVTFTESGLPLSMGFEWFVNVTGQKSASSTTSVITLALPNGAYNYAIGSSSDYLNPGGLAYTGWSPTPLSGTFTVSSSPVSETVVFANTGWPVTFTETGLPSGTLWNVTVFDGAGTVTESSTSPTILFSLTNGTYGYTVGGIPGYVSDSGNRFLVWGAPLGVMIPFNPLTGITFTESGLTGGTWDVTILEQTITAAFGSPIVFNLPNGTYTYTVGPENGFHTPAPGTVTAAGTPVSQSVVFVPYTYGVAFSESGLPSGLTWSVTFNGVTMSLTTNGGTDVLTFAAEPNGTYSYSIAGNAGYHQSTIPYSGTLTVSGAALSENLSYNGVTYGVSFSESGLPSGLTWSVTFNGVTMSVTTNGGTDVLTFAAEANGTYSYSIAGVPGWHQSTIPYSGSLTVNGAPLSESVVFTKVTYAVTFTESGLPSGLTWTVTVNGTPMSLTTNGGTDSLVFQEPNGTYAYAITDISGWHETGTHYSGTVTVAGAPKTFSMVYTQVTYTVTFKESGLPSGLSWTVTVNGTPMGLTTNGATDSLVFHEANGTLPYSITGISGWHQATLPYTGSVVVNGASVTEPTLKYKLVTYSVVFKESGLPAGLNWTVRVNTETLYLTTTGGTDTLTFTGLVNGTYSYSVTGNSGWHQTTLPYNGNVTVNGASVTEPTLKYKQVTYTVTFSESGIRAGLTWRVTVNGHTMSLTTNGGTDSLAFTEANGTYNYSITSPNGWVQSTLPTSGTVTVNGASVTEPTCVYTKV